MSRVDCWGDGGLWVRVDKWRKSLGGVALRTTIAMLTHIGQCGQVPALSTGKPWRCHDFEHYSRLVDVFIIHVCPSRRSPMQYRFPPPRFSFLSYPSAAGRVMGVFHGMWPVQIQAPPAKLLSLRELISVLREQFWTLFDSFVLGSASRARASSSK